MSIQKGGVFIISDLVVNANRVAAKQRNNVVAAKDVAVWDEGNNSELFAVNILNGIPLAMSGRFFIN